MITKLLGNSDLRITRFGFGAWAAGGGGWQYGWSTQDDKDSIAAIHAALEIGINWIDTAAVYGLGHSEEIVAKALSEWRGTKPYVFTKCGMVWDDKKEVGYSLRADSVRLECEKSLRRLNTDVIDLYQIHWPADGLPETQEGWATLATLQKEGKVRWIGTSNFSRAELRAAQLIAPITSLQPPYSLIRRDVEKEVLPFCEEQGIGVIVYSPMGSGLLTGAMTAERAAKLPSDDWRSKNPEFQEPKLSQNLQLAQRVQELAERRGVSAGALAAAWTLSNPAVTGAIIGARNARQVQEVFPHADLVVTRDELTDAGS
ncbi:MAG: aldo/keto reductase [Terrimicrobiaceae bacterium]|jgi:aryl-alcohol dehydrogenase-like predicted oxidoreductase